MVSIACALLCFGAGAVRSENGPRITGAAETVFDWTQHACARWDIPDAPARAWRDGQGAVNLVAGSEESRASRGPTLERLRRDCEVVHRGSKSADPAAFDDRSWLAAIVAVPGRPLEALAHVEYHGHAHPGRCTGAYSECWSNAIVALISADEGRSFEHAEPALVAALPYRYDGGAGRRIGYFNPSNVLEHDGHLYVFVFAERYGAQRRGACLLRRPLDGTAQDWRAWDGRAFTVRFADPYAEHISNPERHVCAPVPGLRSTVSSVLEHLPSGRFVAVTPTTGIKPDGQEASGIDWTTSNDLVHWSPPRLLLEVPLLWRRDCKAAAAFAYPSLIDPDSRSRTFDSTDSALWLYLTQMPLNGDCRIGPRRNLVRYPVSWPRG